MKRIFVLFAGALLASCLFISCEKSQDGNGGNGNSGGNNSGGYTESGYFIKHAWGGGDWSWQKMSLNDEGFCFAKGNWGGTGANINTSASDNGAAWFPVNEIVGSDDVRMGEKIIFMYDPQSRLLIVLPEEDNGEGGGNGGGGNNPGGDDDYSKLVETLKVTNVLGSSATLNGKINNHPKENVAWYGFICSDATYALDEDDISKHAGITYYEDKTGVFAYNVEGLKPNTTYYTRAFAHISGDKTYYGAIEQFTTLGADFYIKHPWGHGDWTWKKMEKNGNVYEYTGLFGHDGANINTTPNDNGAMWFEPNNIEGWFNYDVDTANKVKFIYNPSSERLSVERAE